MEGNENQEMNQETKEPKKLSHGAVGIIVIAVVLVLLIVVSLLGRVSINKKSNNQQRTITSQQDSGQKKKVKNVKKERPTEETSLKTDEVDFPSEEKSNSDNSVNDEELKALLKEAVEKENGQMQLVEGEPVLGEPQRMAVVVGSKESYCVDSKSYAYAISFITIDEEDNYSTIKYFCSKGAYDAVSKGDIVSVEYCVDENGIYSISKIYNSGVNK